MHHLVTGTSKCDNADSSTYIAIKGRFSNFIDQLYWDSLNFQNCIYIEFYIILKIINKSTNGKIRGFTDIVRTTQTVALCTYVQCSNTTTASRTDASREQNHATRANSNQPMYITIVYHTTYHANIVCLSQSVSNQMSV